MRKSEVTMGARMPSHRMSRFLTGYPRRCGAFPSYQTTTFTFRRCVLIASTPYKPRCHRTRRGRKVCSLRLARAHTGSGHHRTHSRLLITPCSRPPGPMVREAKFQSLAPLRTRVRNTPHASSNRCKSHERKRHFMWRLPVCT